MMYFSIQQTSFFTNYGHHPWLDIFDFLKVNKFVAKDLANRLFELHATMKVQLQEAQEWQKINVDAYQKKQLQFNVGDKVWLFCHNIKTIRFYDKFDYLRLESFFICRQINWVAYQLYLSESMKIHHVFYVSLLKPKKSMNIPRRRPVLAPRITIDHNEEFDLADILDSRQ